MTSIVLVRDGTIAVACTALIREGATAAAGMILVGDGTTVWRVVVIVLVPVGVVSMLVLAGLIAGEGEQAK